MTSLYDLGKHVAALQDRELEHLQVREDVGQRFIANLRQKPRKPVLTFVFAAAIVVATIALVSFTVRQFSLKPTSLVASSESRIRRLVAPSDQSIPVTFADGSHLELSSGTEAEIHELTTEGARISLGRGKAEMAVIHREKTRYLLHAGPYRVTVVGTRFTLEWQPERDRFELSLKEGSVVVSTDKNAHAKVRMAPSERLIIERGNWQLSPISVALESGLDSTPAESRPVSITTTNANAASSTAPTTIHTPPPNSSNSTPKWLHFGKLGQYNTAFAEAEHLNIATLAQNSSSTSLLTLAEVCRFSGHSSDAMMVLTKLRQRFPNTEESAVAAFQLGRLASNGQQAATWFQNYLRERPQGTLAREATGRLLEALERAGQHVEAVQLAREYLSRYPSGPHATFAKRILGS
jgi:TolA-binding protein